MVELTRPSAMRLIKRSMKVKIDFKEYVLEAHAFPDPMMQISHTVIFERDQALVSLEHAQKDSWLYASMLKNTRKAQKVVEKAHEVTKKTLEAAKGQFHEELARKNSKMQDLGTKVYSLTI